MANTPKKVAVIGLDCAEPRLIEKHIKEGHLPTFKKLIDSGVIAQNCLVPYPTVTPPNWCSIATGAWPGTHQVTDFHVHKPGTTPWNINIVQAFSSERCKAEFLWDTADKAGKKCIVFNYPVSWPSHMKNGIMAGGIGLSIGEYRDGNMAMDSKQQLCSELLITTGIYPSAMKGTFKPAGGWMGLPKDTEEPLEMEVAMNFRNALVAPAPARWYVLARQSKGDGYDMVTLSPTKDLKDAFFTIRPGEWSSRVVTKIEMKDGPAQEVFFRAKLLELSDDAENLRLYLSSLGTTSGWSNPPGIALELKSEEGITGQGGGIQGYMLEWFDLDTFVEINGFYTQYLADSACTLLTKHEWDLFFMHAHSPDWAYHVILTDMNADPKKEPEKYSAAWDAHLKIYEAQDKMLAQIIKACDKDTLFILVSDHGAVGDGPVFNPYEILEKAGLSVLQKEQFEIPKYTRAKGLSEEIAIGIKIPDIHKSKCFPQRSLYVYINLKGRDPEGIVDPEDYEKVQQQIIDALLTYVDPATSMRPVSLALSKRDARILGLYGDAVGDVVYALYPWYSGQHGNILPGAKWGIGSLEGLLTFTGPGIKKGYKLERTCNLIDIVPTVCYLMDLPIPPQAEGAVLYQAMQDPDFKIKKK